MASHHTKDKGDMRVYMVSDLGRNGIGICMPISEHPPFDLVAVSDAGQVRRVQVKYRSLSKIGTVAIDVTNNHPDRNGVHGKQTDINSFDCFAAYCPESERVYYVRNEKIPLCIGRTFSLRTRLPRNNQRQKVNIASDYEGAHRIFEYCPRSLTDKATAF